jgi:hypothetical protein
MAAIRVDRIIRLNTPSGGERNEVERADVCRKGTLIIKTTAGRHAVMGVCYPLALGCGSISKYIGARSDE